MKAFRARLFELYHGTTKGAVRFQRSIIAIIAFFLVAPLIADRPVFYWLDYSIAALVFADLAARALAAKDLIPAAPTISTSAIKIASLGTT